MHNIQQLKAALATALMLLVPSSCLAQAAAGALKGLGDSMQGIGAEMQRSANQMEIDRQRALRQQEIDRQRALQQQERDRLEFERRQQLIERQGLLDAERARQQQVENDRFALQRKAQLEEQARIQDEIDRMKVERAHPGWEKTVATPKFDVWVKRQPVSVQRLVQSPNPDDAILLLDLYKRDTTTKSSIQKLKK